MVKALPQLRGDPILIVNSDNIWTDGPQDSIRHLARHWDGEKMDALLLLIRQASATGHGGRGDFHMDGDGKLSRRKPGRIAPFVYTGIQLISPRLLDGAPEGAFRPTSCGTARSRRDGSMACRTWGSGSTSALRRASRRPKPR